MSPSDPLPTPPNGGAFSAFLNPQSMLTPGIAGATTMMMANALGRAFDFNVPATGLIISGMFGLLVIVAGEPLVKKIVYYFLNSLVIFCVAMGSGNIAHEVAVADAPRQETLVLVGVANAQPASADTSVQSTEMLSKIERINRDPNFSAAEKVRQMEQLLKHQAQPAPEMQKKSPFFQQWTVFPRR